jgi:hypothetical protein
MNAEQQLAVEREVERLRQQWGGNFVHLSYIDIRTIPGEEESDVREYPYEDLIPVVEAMGYRVVYLHSDAAAILFREPRVVRRGPARYEVRIGNQAVTCPRPLVSSHDAEEYLRQVFRDRPARNPLLDDNESLMVALRPHTTDEH